MKITILDTELMPPAYQIYSDRTRYDVTAELEGLGVVKVPVLQADMAAGGIYDGLAAGLETSIREILSGSGFEFLKTTEIKTA